MSFRQKGGLDARSSVYQREVALVDGDQENGPFVRVDVARYQATLLPLS